VTVRRPRGQGGSQRFVATADGSLGQDQPSQGATATPEPLSAVYEAMSEREFQADVVQGLEQRGWWVFVVPDMRRTRAGLPDILAIHPDWDFMLALELKSQGGRVRSEQREMLAIMHRIPGIYAAVVRPSEWAALSAWIDMVTTTGGGR
jgi:hypothetical protein